MWPHKEKREASRPIWPAATYQLDLETGNLHVWNCPEGHVNDFTCSGMVNCAVPECGRLCKVIIGPVPAFERDPVETWEGDDRP